jgi:prephenate dehydrogenase
MRSVAVVGAGLIGTSVALALTRRGITVYLLDDNPEAACTAASLGAGKVAELTEPADLAVIAVPPVQVAAVLAAQQKNGLARVYTDVASVKRRVEDEAQTLACDMACFVGGHPLAGRELSGPLAARADLFEGKPWVLTVNGTTHPHARDEALQLVSLCGAVPVMLDSDAHDRAVALVSHAPQVVASLMAAQLLEGEDFAVRLSGQGLRDVTRIAAGDATLWTDILSSNAAAVVDVLDGLCEDLRTTVTALRRLSDDCSEAPHGTAQLTGVLRRGNAGHKRIPGKNITADISTLACLASGALP